MASENIKEQDTAKVGGISFEKTISFLKTRWITLAISLIVIAAGVVFYFINGGFNVGVDFKGGTRVQAQLNVDNINIQEVRKAFADKNIQAEINTIGDASEKIFMITTPASEDPSHDDIAKISEFLENNYGKEKVVIRGSELVGPKMGQTFAERSIQLLIIVTFLILIYVAFRFDFFYGAGAIGALFHDVLVMLSFAVFLNIPIDITVIAAILTILGYSINDTIVVFDRIRELHNINKDEDYALVVNKSLTQTLNRTVITSFTTFIVATTLYIWGGQVLNSFALMLMIGIVSGTYSSIFIASPITYMLRKAFDKKEKKLKKA